MTIVIFALVFLVPIVVLPRYIENSFNTPKCLIIFAGAAILLITYLCQSAFGKRKTPTLSKSLIAIIGMVFAVNCFSFLYTANPYYTRHAVSLHLACVVIMLGAAMSFHDVVAVLRLHKVVAITGLIVSMEAWLQFFNVFFIMPWMTPGMMVTSTIGNSNYLGAYLLFPLFSTATLFFHANRWLYRGTYAILFWFVFCAFLFSRARASWMAFGFAFPIFTWVAWRFTSLRMPKVKEALAVSLLLIAIGWHTWNALPDRFHHMMIPRQVFQTDTLALRVKKYMTVGFRLFLENPLYGIGIWGYRNQVYQAQGEINQAAGGKWFDDYPEPKPREMHW